MEKLPVSLLSGTGVMASISTASVLQYLFPAFRLGGVPLAGAIGLLVGWTFACPLVWVLARVLDRTRMNLVFVAAVAASVILSIPAFFFASSLGWVGPHAAILALGILLGGSGLVWGGYLDFDHPGNF